MKKLLITSIYLCFSIFFILAQTNIDSLENILKKSDSDIEKIKALNILSYEYLFTDTAKANRCVRQLISFSELSNDLLVKALAFRALGDQY